MRVISRYLDCPPRERWRRIGVFVLMAAVLCVPGLVTFAMLISGNA